MRYILTILVFSPLFLKAQRITVFYEEVINEKNNQVIVSSEGYTNKTDHDIIHYENDLINKEIPTYSIKTILKIDESKSIYYPLKRRTNDTLVSNNTSGVGRKIGVKKIRLNNEQIIFRDLKNKKSVTSFTSHIFDYTKKNFLIEESLVINNWIMSKSKKKIKKYQCKKAIIKKYKFPYSDFPNHTNIDEDLEVWYTEEIPISQGPREFWGLPGLILEIKHGRKVIKANQIIIDSEEFTIEPPTRGEKISYQEFLDLPAKLFNEN